MPPDPDGLGSTDCRRRGPCHSDRRLREELISPYCVGSDAEPRPFVDSPSGADPGADEMVERIDRQERKPDPGPRRAAVLRGRVLGSLPSSFESNRADHSLYREKPGYGRVGAPPGMLAMVQRGLAGETARPTNPLGSLKPECRNYRSRVFLYIGFRHRLSACGCIDTYFLSAGKRISIGFEGLARICNTAQWWYV
jgi:hypothetical protein